MRLQQSELDTKSKVKSVKMFFPEQDFDAELQGRIKTFNELTITTAQRDTQSICLTVSPELCITTQKDAADFVLHLLDCSYIK